MNLDFTLLADEQDTAPTVARWYFDEWASQSPTATFDSVLSNVSKCTNRDSAPLILLAKAGHECIGVAELKLNEIPHYQDFKHWIGGVYVVPEHRGQGVGSELVKEVISICHASGISTLYLQTEDLSGGIYSQLGFKVVEEYAGSGRRVLVMTMSGIGGT